MRSLQRSILRKAENAGVKLTNQLFNEFVSDLAGTVRTAINFQSLQLAEKQDRNEPSTFRERAFHL
ncbi:MAG: hypothetical protein DMF60_13355 [Acidobacteria bacterium]|nr:MAG: hypothetical protein DMF60_13355 [Acidobacteriota bacterium]